MIGNTKRNFGLKSKERKKNYQSHLLMIEEIKVFVEEGFYDYLD